LLNIFEQTPLVYVSN